MAEAQPDVSVLPGIPGQIQRLDTGEGAYPSTTTDVIKLLREKGLSVEYIEERENRSTVSYKAADIWIPVLVFAQQVSWDVAVDYLTNAITELFGRRLSQSQLKVEIGKAQADGETKWFRASGQADAVLKAMREADIDE